MAESLSINRNNYSLPYVKIESDEKPSTGYSKLLGEAHSNPSLREAADNWVSNSSTYYEKREAAKTIFQETEAAVASSADPKYDQLRLIEELLDFAAGTDGHDPRSHPPPPPYPDPPPYPNPPPYPDPPPYPSSGRAVVKSSD
ncbi:hypothetical protein [Pandoraea pulmonicola]|uniref:Uncharacterized protein n=1 Tax=Pandoraea pulmonicola TaxID=93221 RepID=A0AAJ4ZB22_PANPU|nr:hypothetical protein [Pandoraea pulmonicola]SUA90077.1 Uncharacterised protein [Pandoraea pulmonicola]